MNLKRYFEFEIFVGLKLLIFLFLKIIINLFDLGV